MERAKPSWGASFTGAAIGTLAAAITGQVGGIALYAVGVIEYDADGRLTHGSVLPAVVANVLLTLVAAPAIRGFMIWRRKAVFEWRALLIADVVLAPFMVTLGAFPIFFAGWAVVLRRFAPATAIPSPPTGDAEPAVT